MANTSKLMVAGEVGGRFSYTCRESDIAYFVDRCRRAGVDRLLHSYYHAPSPEYPSYLSHKDQLLRVEPYSYGDASPIAQLVRTAHAAGMKVISMINVATAGQWIRADYLASGEVWPYTRLVGGGEELARYWTRTRDGKTWLDVGPRDSLGAYGYVSLAYPEVRERERSVYLDFVDRYGSDGVQLEFMITRPPRYARAAQRSQLACCDDDGYWAYGYDQPAIAAYLEEYGVDPRTLRNSDPSWVAFRAGYVTQHLRELREALRERDRAVEVSILAFSGTFNSPMDGLAVGVDWETWLEEGLVDSIYCRTPGDMPFLPPRERFAPERTEAIAEEFRDIKKAVRGRAALWPVIELPIYPLSAPGQITPQEVVDGTERIGRALIQEGAKHMGFWWFDTLEQLEVWPAVEAIGRLLSDEG